MRFLVPALVIVLALAVYWLTRTPAQDTATLKALPADVVSGGAASSASKDSTESENVALPAPIRMRSAPQIEGIVTPIASNDSLADSYQREERDEAQAKVHDGAIRGIVEELAESEIGTAHIEDLDCRSRHCKLRLASDDETGLVKLVDALQDERGFLGRAESMMLSRQDDDIVLYLRFSRPK